MGRQQKDASRKRRMQVTCNNPIEKGFTPDKIREVMERWKTEYYCFCYETGEQGTYHFHLYIVFKNPQPFKTISKAFGDAHIEFTIGTSPENRDYVRKEGKYADSEKATTNHIETFYESGECPDDEREFQGHRTDLDIINEMLEGGMTPSQILDPLPFQYHQHEQSIRAKYFSKRWKETPTLRKVTVYWHVGDSGTGKTFTYTQLCEKYGEESVYLLTDYDVGGFDRYCGEPVLFMDEFKSSMKFRQLLNYLEGYKIQVHCRYANACALWTEVHISSIYPPDEAYRFMVDEENRDRDNIKQLLRRINTIVYHYKEGDAYKTFTLPAAEYKDYDDLKSRVGKDFDEVPPNETTPFDEDIRSPPKKEDCYIQVNIKDIETKDDFEIFNEVTNNQQRGA